MTAPAQDAFDEFLPSMLDRPLRPPSARVEARGGRRARVELGDFAGHTPYLPGDDLRFLDWRALARSGQKLLRTFDEARHRRLVLVVDASASLAGRTPGLIRLVRLWCFLALHRLDSLDLVLLRGDAPERRLYAGPEAWQSLDASLRDLTLAGTRGLALLDALPDFGRADQDAVILSDFRPDDVTHEVLRRAAHEGRRLLLVFPRTLVEAQQLGLPRGRVRIEDPEGRDVLEVEMGSALHAAFLEEQALWEGRLAAACAEFGHDFLAADLPRDAAASLRVDTWLPFLEETRR